MADSAISILDRNDLSYQTFFSQLVVGSVFKFNPTQFLWEEIEQLAIAQGKKIKKIATGQVLFDVFGESSGWIYLDIKDAAVNIKDDEVMRLKNELNQCYVRIDNLEVQVGLRGTERLSRCEICKGYLLPFQNKVTTESDGEAHAECVLSLTVKSLEALIKRKEEAARRWSEEAQRIAAENHEMVTTNRDHIEQIALLKEERKLFAELSGELKNRLELSEKEVTMFKDERDKLKKDYSGCSVLNLEYLKATTRSIEILKRARRILGAGDGNEYCPAPQVPLSGETKEQLKGWFYPVYCDVIDHIAHLSDLIDE